MLQPSFLALRSVLEGARGGRGPPARPVALPGGSAPAPRRSPHLPPRAAAAPPFAVPGASQPTPQNPVLGAAPRPGGTPSGPPWAAWRARRSRKAGCREAAPARASSSRRDGRIRAQPRSTAASGQRWPLKRGPRCRQLRRWCRQLRRWCRQLLRQQPCCRPMPHLPRSSLGQRRRHRRNRRPGPPQPPQPMKTVPASQLQTGGRPGRRPQPPGWAG